MTTTEEPKSTGTARVWNCDPSLPDDHDHDAESCTMKCVPLNERAISQLQTLLREDTARNAWYEYHC